MAVPSVGTGAAQVIAVGLGFSFLLLSTAIARQVTTADLSGKKICWNDGGVETYYAGGKYSGSGYGDGTWAVTAAGVEVRAKTGSWAADIEKLADGTFSSAVVPYGGQTWRFTGQYCK